MTDYELLEPIEKARLQSIISRTRSGIETYIAKQQNLVNNAVIRAKENIKTRILSQDIYTIDEFADISVIYDEDEYDKLLIEYNELANKYDKKTKEYDVLTTIYKQDVLKNK